MTAISSMGHQGTEKERTLLENQAYLELFQGDMYMITNTNMLEFTLPDAYGVFRDNGVRSVMQHLLRDMDGNLAGMVLAEECVNLKHFPKLAVQLFENMSKIINAVLLKERVMPIAAGERKIQ